MTRHERALLYLALGLASGALANDAHGAYIWFWGAMEVFWGAWFTWHLIGDFREWRSTKQT